MAVSGAAFTRANAALAKTQTLSTSLASSAPGADGASRIASNHTTGGSLWSSMAGFVTALLNGQVTHSLPTRAQMAANKIPAAITTIATSGYSAAGDGGAATYVRAAGPFTDGSSFQDNGGTWWRLSMPIVTFEMFGAVGGALGTSYSALPDDTTAIQAAISYAVLTGCSIWGAGIGGISYLDTDNNPGYAPRLIADTRVIFPTESLNNPTNFDFGWRGGTNSIVTAAYKGGSGLLNVVGGTSPPRFNPSPLYWNGANAGELSYTYATFVMTGGFNATWAASGTIQFQFHQTIAGVTTTVTLTNLTGTTALPALSGGRWRFTVELYGGGSGSFQAEWLFKVLGKTAYPEQGGYVDLLSQGLNAQNGAPITVKQSISNSGSNPLTNARWKLEAA